MVTWRLREVKTNGWLPACSKARRLASSVLEVQRLLGDEGKHAFTTVQAMAAEHALCRHPAQRRQQVHHVIGKLVAGLARPVGLADHNSSEMPMIMRTAVRK
jgi:hypothetical protein